MKASVDEWGATLGDDKADIFIRVGVTLLHMQATEAAIRHVMTFVLQRDVGLTLESLQTQEKEEQHKTIGYFLGQLRRRADIAPQFDATLRLFLENRNKLVHRAEEVPGWNLETPEGREVARGFVDALLNQSSQVLLTFAGLIRLWQKTAGLENIGDPRILKLLDEVHGPQSASIFFAKK